MTTYGYARVSTKEQNVSRQLDALLAFPLEERDIYVDYYSGASFSRPTYQRQAEGIAAARARGMRFGRPPIARPEAYRGIRQRVSRGELTHVRAAQELGVSRSTFEKWLREDRGV